MVIEPPLDVDQIEGHRPGKFDQFPVATERGEPEVATTLLRGRHERPLPPQFEIDLGEFEAVGAGDEGLHSRIRSGLGRGDEPAVRLELPATDPAAQLVELRDPEAVGVEDDHHRRVRHVDSDLDHRGGDEHVDLTAPEGGHRLLLLHRAHPSVQEAEPAVGQLSVGEPFEGLLG